MLLLFSFSTSYVLLLAAAAVVVAVDRSSLGKVVAIATNSVFTGIHSLENLRSNRLLFTTTPFSSSCSLSTSSTSASLQHDRRWLLRRLLPLVLEPITFSHFAYLVTSSTLAWAALTAVVLVLATGTNAAPLPLSSDRIGSGAGGSVGCLLMSYYLLLLLQLSELLLLMQVL